MPDIRNISNNIELLYTWGRYLYWADLMFRDWDKYMTEKGANAKETLSEWLGVSSYWGASLYVAIEGWERAQFKDPIIDALLGVKNYKDVLRRLRNGTFHYQTELASEKLIGFFHSPEATLWLWMVHDEFCRWLRDCVELIGGGARLSPERAEKWREDFARLIGWLPLRPVEKEQESLRKVMVEIRQELDASGDNSDAAREFRASLSSDYDDAVQKSADLVRQYRRNNLAVFGLNPDNYIQ